MPKSKIAIFLFVFLFSIAGFFIGMLVSRFFIPKSAGLAGGVMVLAYGVAGFIISLLAGLLLHRYFSNNLMKTFTMLFGIFNLVMVASLYFKIKENKSADQIPVLPNKTVTEAIDAPLSSPSIHSDANEELSSEIPYL